MSKTVLLCPVILSERPHSCNTLMYCAQSECKWSTSSCNFRELNYNIHSLVSHGVLTHSIASTYYIILHVCPSMIMIVYVK